MVLEHHLWLNLMEIKDAKKTALLDSPVSPAALFGSVVNGFAELFTGAQKSLQAMGHFFPKRASSAAASGPPMPQPTQHHTLYACSAQGRT